MAGLEVLHLPGGDYTLRIRTVVRQLAHLGALGKEDLFVPELSRYHRVHEVALQAEQPYSIDLRSFEFRTRLVVEDSAGQRLAEDQVAGPLANARLTFITSTSSSSTA